MPDLGDEEAGPVIVPESRSYFPKKVEKAPLLDNEEALRDTVSLYPRRQLSHAPQDFALDSFASSLHRQFCDCTCVPMFTDNYDN